MIQETVTMGDGGRIVIPAIVRKALQIKVGDEIIIRMEGDEVRLSTQQQALKKLRTLVKKTCKKPKSMSFTDDFIKFRRQFSGE